MSTVNTSCIGFLTLLLDANCKRHGPLFRSVKSQTPKEDRNPRVTLWSAAAAFACFGAFLLFKASSISHFAAGPPPDDPASCGGAEMRMWRG